MRKEAYKVLVSTALGVAAGLSACEATGVTNFILDSQAEKPENLLDEVDLTKTNIVTKTEGRAVRGRFGN